MTHADDSTSLLAQPYYSGFAQAHDTYNAIGAASNGKIYYVLSSASLEQGGQMYVFDPVTEAITWLADLTTICGEADQKAVPQGKSHVNFYESHGKLYFATHVGFYETIAGMERMPKQLPAGYVPYPGGHILSYDLSSGEFQDLATAPDGEGILTMTMDQAGGHVYAISWPRGNFLHYELEGKALHNLGPISEQGEAGTPGEDYRVLCRSLLVDPRHGSVYFSTAEGDIFTYHPTTGSIQKVKGVDLRLDYFGQYDPTQPGSMGYHWRKIVWHPAEEVAYGVHGNSGYLFRFDPRQSALELVERITSEPSQRSGMFDQFSYGYLGFALGPDEETLYYLTGGPIYTNGQRVAGQARIAKGGARGLENLHLITYHLPSRTYRDHGPIRYADGTRPTYVNSIAIGPDGQVYTLARFEHHGKVIQDLVRIAIE